MTFESLHRSLLQRIQSLDFPTQDQLENLKYYKYAAVDKSPVSQHVLRHYWNWAITLFPLWIAPNLITLIGLLFMVTNVIFVALIVPDLESEGPSWLYFSFAIGLWLYSTFDNVDGRQARRTHTSSPLGELFDHGCDALNTTYVSLLQAAALGLGHTQLTAVLFVVTMAGFYLSTAEEYYTGVLYLGYINGPTEGIIFTCLAFIWSGCYGVASWHVPIQDVPSLSWLSWMVPENTTAAAIFVWGTALLLVFTHLPVVLYSVYLACRAKSLDIAEAGLNALVPFAVFCLADYAWLMSPYSIVFRDQHLVLFLLTTGTLFGLIASNVILAHLTKSAYPNLWWLVAPIVIMCLLVNMPSILGITLLTSGMEYGILCVLCVVFFTWYGVWSWAVIDGFCRYLGIRCLVIHRDNRSNDVSASTSSGK
ncbi:CDP-alcohol phosphatidyltransferase-domain-containing protein [Radiomyces spectabilis]|uniref:CDP-alcohol phosphatidyltransferase-domain-containing protein n=1 Tax=Radiomyces spectabilis TaxID=64574 RepID=UPI00221EEACB|nr:CDP-alcohol phosphatidyltransferase-domain-containing protein [Radiomyces spectabilis]KAI8365273.1 CDP-alcohol phosphatidyltransferase-domain-containing protein [Radiomyces spectabilis]